MFLIPDGSTAYRDPWYSPLPQRLASLQGGAPRIAYFSEEINNSTFRYRIYNMIQALRAGSTGIAASHFHLADLRYEDHILDGCDALVISRARYSDKINRLITKAKSRGRTVFFDTDDLIFDTRYAHLIMNTIGHDASDIETIDMWFAHISRMGETLRMCDHAIVTNEFLADRVREFNAMPVSVIPNFVNLEQWTVSDAIYEHKLKTGFAHDGKIHVGYFSGSPTHSRDLELIADTLARLLLQEPRMVLRLAGFVPLPPSLQKQTQRIEQHSFQDFVNLQRLVGSTQLNLVPLQDNIFTHCKSELKYFEAAAVGTLTIASPTYTYRQSIRDGENGYLAHALEWELKIKQALASYDEQAETVRRAHDEVRDFYHWRTQAGVIEKTIFG